MKIFLCFDCKKENTVNVVGCGLTAVPNNECATCLKKNQEDCPLKEQSQHLVIDDKWRCPKCNNIRYACGC